MKVGVMMCGRLYIYIYIYIYIYVHIIVHVGQAPVGSAVPHITDVNCKEIARQWTLQEFEWFSQIKVRNRSLKRQKEFSLSHCLSARIRSLIMPFLRDMNNSMSIRVCSPCVLSCFHNIHVYVHELSQPIELFKQAWSKEKLQHLSPNVMGMINHFNDVSR